MNNDISRDIASYNKIQIPTSRIELSKTTEAIQPEEKETDTNAMDCLGAMGCAQVKMYNKNDSIRKSLEEFQQDPFSAQMKMEMCDSLMNEKGYDVWQAINITDNFFKALKQEDLYR